jgi:hypothetical protein
MKKALTVAACGVSLAAAVFAAGPAGASSAVSHARSTGGLRATLTPNKNVKPGTRMTVRATHALRSKKYYCSQILIKRGSTSAYVPNLPSIRQVTSTSTGTLHCTETFKPFSGTYGGKKISCPTTAANKAAGWSCAFGVADVASQGVKSGATLYFTAVR